MKRLVLVADDHRDILSLVTFRLEQSGDGVVLARDGAEALELARVREPDLAVVDLMMPRLAGLEVTRALRQDERTLDLPVILLTARAQKADVERGLAAGANPYVPKPFSSQELRDRVGELLEGR